MWWPTWHEIRAELVQRTSQRMALANFARAALRHNAPALEAPGKAAPSPEERARAVETWERMREGFVAPEEAPKAKETPEQVLDRYRNDPNQPVTIATKDMARSLLDQAERLADEKFRESRDDQA
jgi:hypothetical protein